jgi:protein-tyrosine phosphatase
MLMEFARRSQAHEVPDPYYGGPDGFDLVLNLVEDAAEGLLDYLERELARVGGG